jgi:hypothetical protein
LHMKQPVRLSWAAILAPPEAAVVRLRRES